MEDFKALYEKMTQHRNSLAVRNAAMEFELSLAKERIVELDERAKALSPVPPEELSLAERAALVETPEFW